MLAILSGVGAGRANRTVGFLLGFIPTVFTPPIRAEQIPVLRPPSPHRGFVEWIHRMCSPYRSEIIQRSDLSANDVCAPYFHNSFLDNAL